ncbi:L-serine ammonia-lyase [Noviherbaspirillum sp.]|uniref:L-serine ammonia-lyase n=1 Tax=Noviherbaspirillum sp. TaxID=1926288 RepID=UPI002FE356FE
MDMRVFDLFKVGIGPSSSHTVGPMLAARRFLHESGALADTKGVTVELFGSLALTGAGHATDRAILLGLSGELPDRIEPETIESKLAVIAASKTVRLLGRHPVPFDVERDLIWHRQLSLPGHPNGMRFTLALNDGTLHQRVFYSTGGGLIHAEDEVGTTDAGPPRTLPFPFDDMATLLAHGRGSGLSIAQMLRANECVHADNDALDAGLDRIWDVMSACIERALSRQGELPGGLNVRRRAAALWQAARDDAPGLPHDAIHKVSLYAMAVNEENAAGGRVVTAPTNGAAGIVPAVLRYYAVDCRPADPANGIRDFLLAASAVGMLCKRNASISGAEVGCQGEVGVACAMAAAGLAAALGGTNDQIETAAEIGIEHHLGMTCDPIGGLVQIPCIERNGMGAVKAITAASLALSGDGMHHVSLDQVIETMRQTGADMQAKYKETSLGGLAVHVISVNHAAC